MTDSPQDHGDNEKLQAALRREQRRAAELEARVAGLEGELDTARNRLARLSARRSVRLALKAAELGRPIVAALRRLRREPEQPPMPDAATVAAEIRRLRPEAGPVAGPLVTIVMLNRNGARYLSRVLPSLRDNTNYRSFELVVVDNGSSDESLALLRRDWEFPLRVIANEGNESFSHGCNQGIAWANGDYVLLLNNDVDPVTPGWLGHLVTGLEEDSSRGAAGALLVYPERPGFVSRDPNTGPDLTVQHRGIAFRWRRNAAPEATVPWAYNLGVGEDPTRSDLVATEEVPAATAACLLIKTSLLQELGGFDEGFTYGMEDVDLCVRIRRSGHNIVLVGNAALFHHEFGTQSEGAAARKRANLRHGTRWVPRGVEARC
jgi:GT2 family glycosyltransferase